MTQETPQPGDAHDSRSTVPKDASNGPSKSLHPPRDSVSDNDASERATREQLKKTSIASLSKHATEFQDIIPRSDDIPMSIPDSIQNEQSSKKENPRPDVDNTRGRPMRKRSFDDLGAADAEVEKREASEKRGEKWNGHVRKRSRDVRAGEPFKEDGRSRGITIPVQEETEDAIDEKEPQEPMDSSGHTAEEHTAEAIQIHSDAEIEVDGNDMEVREPARQKTGGTTPPTPTEAEKELMDQEMRDSTASPRKKRSRDQFDSDPDREQKIAATEETRAHRRSDEIDRAKNLSLNGQPLVRQQGPTTTQNEPDAPQFSSRASTAEAETKKVPSVFGSTSALTSVPAPNKNEPPAKSPSDNTSTRTDQQSQTSASAFASSGFAALSTSATSPFGALGATSGAGSTASPFASASAFSPKKVDSDAPNTTEPKANGGFGSFGKASSSGFGNTEPSPFGTAGAAKPAVFGGSVFGGGFGSGFGGGGRLSNFAASTGDAKLGAVNGAIKPIGSPTREDDDDDDSENDGEGFGESSKEGNDEADERFQHQDGKH